MAKESKSYSIAFAIGAKMDSKFSATFKKAAAEVTALGKIAKKHNAELGKFLSSSAKWVTGVATSITAAATLAVNNLASAAEGVTSNSSKLRMTASEYQRLAYAFGQAGISAEDFGGAVGNMNALLAKSSGDKKFAQDFADKTGLSAQKLLGLDAEQRLKRTASYLAKIENPAKRARIAMELFGTTLGTKMLGAMEQGGDAIDALCKKFTDMGGEISETTLQAARDYTKNKQNLGIMTRVAQQNLVGGLLPAFSNVYEKLAKYLEENAAKFKEWGERIATRISEITPKVEDLWNKFKQLFTWASGKAGALIDFLGGGEGIARLAAGIWSAMFAFKALNATVASATAIKALVGLLKEKGAFAALAAKLGPWGLAIGAISLAVGVLIAKWDVLGPHVMKIIGVLRRAWDAFCDRFGGHFAEVWQAMVGLWEELAPIVGWVVNAIKRLWEKIGPVVTAVAERIFSVVLSIVETLLKLITIAVQKITSVISWVKEKWGGFSGWIGEKTTAISTFFSDAWTSAREAAGAAYDRISEKWGGFTGWVGEKSAAISTFFGDAWTSATSAASDAWNDVTTSASEAIERVREIVARIPQFFSDAWEAAKASVGGFVQSIIDKFAPLTNFFDNIKSKISGIFGGKKTLNVDVQTTQTPGPVGYLPDGTPMPGHALGGIFTQPHVAQIAERGAEAVIPLQNTSKAFDLWQKTAQLAGFGGRAHSETWDGGEGASVAPSLAPVISSGGATFAPVVNLNISGKATPETVRQLEQSSRKISQDMRKMMDAWWSEKSNRQTRLSYDY